MTQRRIIAASALALAAALTTLGPAAGASEGPFGPIRVAVNRHQYTGRGCPIEVVYTGSINLEPHGPLRLGAAGKEYDAGVTLFVNSGNTHLSEPSALVHIRCT